MMELNLNPRELTIRERSEQSLSLNRFRVSQRNLHSKEERPSIQLRPFSPRPLHLRGILCPYCRKIDSTKAWVGCQRAVQGILREILVRISVCHIKTRLPQVIWQQVRISTTGIVERSSIAVAPPPAASGQQEDVHAHGEEPKMILRSNGTGRLAEVGQSLVELFTHNVFYLLGGR